MASTQVCPTVHLSCHLGLSQLGQSLQQAGSLKLFPISSRTRAVIPSQFRKLSDGFQGRFAPCQKVQRQAVCGKFVCRAAAGAEATAETQSATSNGIDYTGLHHTGLLVENIDKALEFYMGTLGLHLNDDRPADKLPYKGAWLWVGAEMIHLMELPNPDPKEGRPEHGGRDRHTCVGVVDLEPVKQVLEQAGVRYTMSKSGRPALFCRDPDGNALEISQLGQQHEGSNVQHL